MRNIALIFFLKCFVYCSSQSNNSIRDIFFYSKQYKFCKSEKCSDSVFVNFIKIINNKIEHSLNRLAYAKSIDRYGNHKRALEIIDPIKLDFDEQPKIIKVEYYSLLADLSLRTQNPELAKTQLTKAIKLFDNKISPEIQQNKFMAMGTIYNALNEPSQAMSYFEKASRFVVDSNHQNWLYLKLNKALTNLKLNQLKEAKELFLSLINKQELKEDSYAFSRTLGNIGDIYYFEDSLDKAESAFNHANDIALKAGLYIDRLRYEDALSKVFTKRHNYKKALEHLKRSDSINHIYNKLEITEKITSIELQYEIDKEKYKAEFNIMLLQSERRQKISFIILLCVSLILILFLALYINKIRSKNKALLHQNIISTQFKPQLKKANEPDNKTDLEKYQSLISKLSKLIFEDKLYTNNEVSLELLSKLLETNRTYLSEAINNYYGLSFSSWMNEVRINEAKRLMLNSQMDKYSIEGISKLVGFSSISSFNSNFKKITGLTPSYFRLNRNNDTISS